MTIKDWGTLITAIIGSVLGIINFFHTRRLENRLNLQPYFDNQWPEFSKRLSLHVQWTQEWLHLESTLTGDIPPDHLSLPILNEEPPQLDNEAAKYDRQFTKSLKSYSTRWKNLRGSVLEFNRLLDPVSRSFVRN